MLKKTMQEHTWNTVGRAGMMMWSRGQTCLLIASVHAVVEL